MKPMFPNFSEQGPVTCEHSVMPEGDILLSTSIDELQLLVEGAALIWSKTSDELRQYRTDLAEKGLTLGAARDDEQAKTLQKREAVASRLWENLSALAHDPDAITRYTS